MGQGNVYTVVRLFTGGGGEFGFPACITGHMQHRGGGGGGGFGFPAYIRSHDQGVCIKEGLDLGTGGLHPGRGGGSASGGADLPAGTGKAGGTHPTGMLPCKQKDHGKKTVGKKLT